MKKLVSVLVATLLAVCILLCACSQKQITVLQESDNFVVLIFDSGFNGKTLSEAMENAKQNEQIDYTVEKGMVTTINGITNADNKYWMLYTDDEDFANTAWGEITYQDKTYGSATKGISDLIVKDGKTYIWVYTEINY